MNTYLKSTFDAKKIIGVTVLSGLISFATASTFFKSHTTAPSVNNVVSVSIVGKRMTPEQKLSYDLEQLEQTNAVTQVVISAKRLTAEEKLQMDQEDRALQTSLNTKSTRRTKNG